MLCLSQSGVIRGLAKLTPTVLCLSAFAVFSPPEAQATTTKNALAGGTPFFALSFVWGGLGILVVAAAVAGLVLARRYRQFRESRQNIRPAQTRPVVQTTAPSTPSTRPAALPSNPPLAASKPRALEPLPPAQVHLPSSASPQPKRPTPTVPVAKSNGKPLKFLNGHHSRRRKIFDYNRYFADLMSTVSGHAGELGGSAVLLNPPAGVAPQPATNGGSPPSNGASRANSELIASQTAFIEEQRRLIQEQTRVIEEKTKLIAEKNQLLKMQTEMLENKLL